MTVSSLFITGGQVVAYIIGWLFSTMPHGWKWIVGLGALPAALQFFTLGFMPETPRWLVKANRKDRARRVLKKVYGVEADAKDKLVEALLRRVEREVLEEEEAANARRHPDTPKGGLRGKIAALTDGLNELVGVGAHRRALIIACMLQGYQQLCGFNSLMYFSASIFLLVGFRSPTLTSLSIALTNFAFTLVAFHSIDRVGRRRILLLSIPIMVLGLGLCSVAFNFLDLPDQEANGASAVMARAAQEAQQGGGFWALVILLAMVVYVAGYAVGMGNVPWQQSEYVQTSSPPRALSPSNFPHLLRGRFQYCNGSNRPVGSGSIHPAASVQQDQLRLHTDGCFRSPREGRAALLLQPTCFLPPSSPNQENPYGMVGIANKS